MQPSLTGDPAQVTVPPIYPGTPAVRDGLARLYTNIETMDTHLRALIQNLKDDGVYGNSYIFFYADNGGNLPWYKREILERGTGTVIAHGECVRLGGRGHRRRWCMVPMESAPVCPLVPEHVGLVARYAEARAAQVYGGSQTF